MKNRGILFAILTLMLFIIGCEKEPYIPPFKYPEPTCVVDRYTCTIFDGSTNDISYGRFIPRYFQDVLRGYKDSSDFAVIDHNFGSNVTFDWENTFYRVGFNSSSFPQYINYDQNSLNQVSIQPNYGSGNKLTYISQTFSHLIDQSNDRVHTIDEIVYQDSNIVSYRYKESLKYSPYTTFKTNYYTLTYDKNRVYNKEAFINYRLFSVMPRPILVRNAVMGDFFDPQSFSKNLITQKTNITTSKVIFENTYQYDASGNVTQHQQDFLYGAGVPITITWDYTYLCE